MTVRGVARLVAGVLADVARGVGICVAAGAAQARDDLRTMLSLNAAIRDAFNQTPDDLLAGYEATRVPLEDRTRRDNVGWQ